MFRAPLLGVVLLQSVWSVLVKPDSQLKPNCEYLSNKTDVHSFLWTLKRDPPSYFFGTIHVPYTRVWHNIPGNVKTAFQKAQKVFFELDLTNHQTISSLANCQLLPKGETLDKVLPRKLYRRLKSHLDYVKLMIPTWMTSGQTTRGLYADYLFNAITGNWRRKRPVWVMLMVNSLTENDIRWRGTPVLDLYLAQEAIRMHKDIGAVERVQEQCQPLNQLSLEQVMFALNQTLLQHEAYRAGEGTTPYTTEELIQHYNCGDLNAVIFNHDTAKVPNLVNSSLSSQDTFTAKNIDSYFRQELIFKRNLRMADRISTLLDTHPNTSFFFAFGAGHFLGNSTVIDHLRQWGHNIEHTQPSNEVDPGNIWDNGHKKDKNPLLHMSADFPVSSIIINGDLDPFYSERRRHRHRHGNKKKRPRDRHRATQSMLKKPMFNDLWVRLQATSFGPNAFFRQQQMQPTTPHLPVRRAVRSGAAILYLSHKLELFIYSLLVSLSVHLLSCC